MREIRIIKRAAMIIFLSLVLAGCNKSEQDNTIEPETNSGINTGINTEINTEVNTQTEIDSIVAISEPAAPAAMVEEADWSEYFGGLNGAAVFYKPDTRHYTIYNPDLVSVRRSPCSTFKIVSSLIGLEKGIIPAEDSVRPWSGEVFWNENWNRDIDFEQAFKTSCIWYFREVINEIGTDIMQEELERLSYGNCDITDWEGRTNTNNNNRALTGFWVESSLKISAKEQVEVMERIFGDNTAYSEESLERLKAAMLLTEDGVPDYNIYGKTGLGKLGGITVDSWYTGFLEAGGEPVYFCIYLGRTDGMEVSSAKAKQIAIRLVGEFTNIE